MTKQALPHHQVVSEIRSRWRPVEFAAAWAAIPVDRRQRVFAELEETARELRESEPALAADLLVALDALESMSAAAALLGAHPASLDIAKLIDLIEHPRPER